MNLGSDTPVVGAPVFDALLDLLAGEVVFESLFGEIDDLVVRGKAKADQLILSEAIDLSCLLYTSHSGEYSLLRSEVSHSSFRFLSLGAKECRR